jgi:hypothetical protein
LTQHFGQVFGLDMRAASQDELLELLRQAELSQNVATPMAQAIMTVQERA